MKKHSKTISIIRNIVFVLLLVIFLAEIALVALLNTQEDKALAHIPYRVLEVGSDSMYPVLKTGDCVVIRLGGYDELQAGDIISYYRSGSLITHEIIERTANNGLITQGRANELPDTAIGESDYLGKVVLRLPKLGNVLTYAQDPGARAMMIALIIVVFLGPDIFSGLYDLINGKKTKKNRQTSAK